MAKETIIYNGQKYNRYPESKRRQLRVYYWKHDKWKSPPIALHRQIWIDNFGEIPAGYSVHHKDGNTFNNSIDNLEIFSKSKHSVLHIAKRRVRKIGICENSQCGREFSYFSIRKAKYCSINCLRECYNASRRKKIEKI